ncbi:MAG: hypothetical protein US54_C0022G0004 [Candidatus Roizmanbacteria bacterium GW2011_GWA2_37_7]|uniref:Cohesin domain-containing protein n=1 Tax=Candidatus Roizmanbacteria bacterium GW2011_GWA2_37_7 TaxID=1618481 RepID=A0A0G0H706_9BACT|nr:MAG: hypothetical protein US54_C0022G0004 [Candidatus Roizmanbacteria bacterium GW2011_GWA2_37_7]
MATIASFSFDPITTTVKQGETVTVDVLIYSGKDPVISSDVWISYNPELLTPITEGLSDIKPGDLFQITDSKIISPGSMYLYAINQSPSEADITNGKLASISFTAHGSGTTDLRFNCIPFQKQTSQIIRRDPELTNIINCTTTRAHTAAITIEAENVLGASTQNTYHSWYVGLALLFTVFIGVLFFRYKRLSKS